MNSYKTFSMRTSPQVVQRSFDFCMFGERFKAHGVKGNNGEWMLEGFVESKWEQLGYAIKRKNLWEMQTQTETFSGKTLKEVIAFVLKRKVATA